MMERPITFNEFIEYRNFFDKHLLMAIELERNIPTDRQMVARAIKTTSMGKNYIDNDFTCDSDGSVPNSNEIILCGKNWTFRQLYERLSFFESRITKLNAEPQDSSCSSHVSLFCLHTMRMPDTILKNVIQLTRAFQLPLYYIAGADKHYICRNNIGQFALPIYKRAIVGKSIANVQSELSKYVIVSIRKSMLRTEDFMQFSVEFRNPDGIRIPSALAAIACLKRAIVRKAISISTKGVISTENLIGTDNWEKEKARMMNWDLIRLRDLSDDAEEQIKSSAHKMLDYLSKEILEEADGELVMKILRKLADKNISLRYFGNAVTNELNTEIDRELLDGTKKLTDFGLSEKEEKVLKFIMDFEQEVDKLGGFYDLIIEATGIPRRTLELIVAKLEDRMGKDLVIVEGKVMFR